MVLCQPRLSQFDLKNVRKKTDYHCCHIYRIWRIWCLIQIHIWVQKSSLSIFWTLLHTLWLWMDKVVSSSMSWPTNSLQFILPWSPHSVTYSLTILIRKITTFRHPKWKNSLQWYMFIKKLCLFFSLFFENPNCRSICFF